jgi:hypothetical protein
MLTDIQAQVKRLRDADPQVEAKGTEEEDVGKSPDPVDLRPPVVLLRYPVLDSMHSIHCTILVEELVAT